MHPIERLRFLARSGPLPAGVLVQEAAGALAGFADDPQGFLTACQRVVARQPGSAPLVWLVARALSSIDPYEELWTAAREMEGDPTGRNLADALTEEARVVVVGGASGSGSALGYALSRRGDLDVWRLRSDASSSSRSSGGSRRSSARTLRTAWWEDGDADGWEDEPGPSDHVTLPAIGLAAAVERADVVVIEAEAFGVDEALVPVGAATAAACGRAMGTPVWAVGGVGRVLGPRMWDGVGAPFRRDDPWNADLEVMHLGLLDQVVGPTGSIALADGALRPDCPECPEVFRGVVM